MSSHVLKKFYNYDPSYCAKRNVINVNNYKIQTIYRD